jgi:hypothetical protein
MAFRSCWLLVAAASLHLGSSALGNFHVMQIEQVIGGVNGDTTSQAVQLRMRSSFQNVVNQATVWAADAAGLNRVLLLNVGGNVANSALGDRVLLTTTSFNQYMVNNGVPAFTPDFTLTNPIPSSYLAAGRLTFEDDFGTIYWSLSWGGAAFTGPQTGIIQYDANGNFGPAFGSALPTATRGGVIFTGAASAPSTTNLADYALSADPATVTKNSRASFVIPAAPVAGDYNGDTHVTMADYTTWKDSYGDVVEAFSGADGNGDTFINAADYTVWRNNLNLFGSGQLAGGAGNQSLANDTTAVPEPTAIVLLLSSLGVARWRRRLSAR